MEKTNDEFEWVDAELTSAHGYLLPCLMRELGALRKNQHVEAKIFDMGCGNGSTAAQLVKAGWEVVGVDPSKQGIEKANQNFPSIKLEEGSAYDNLAERYGSFPVVMSFEVVEHVYAPRKWAETLFSLTAPGGYALVSTPYHGYLKNIALALSGKMDDHFTALWDHGHIKFWSIKTLGTLITEAGFVDLKFIRVGRVPPLAKSMIVVARKPESFIK